MEEETAPIPCVLEGRLAGFLVDKTLPWSRPGGTPKDTKTLLKFLSQRQCHSAQMLGKLASWSLLCGTRPSRPST